LRHTLSILFCTLALTAFSQPKINGVSLVGHPKPFETSEFDHVEAVNANWVTLMPYAYGNFNDPHITYKNLDWQWWGESPAGVTKCIEMAHSRGLKVMVKPQLWFDHGTYTGDFVLKSDEEWRIFERDYRAFLMQFVEISQRLKAEMLCIGTELTQFAVQRPSFWEELIRDIRVMYDGQLTYASNWDSYYTIGFWHALDYVGVDAYFPLCEDKTPEIKAVMAGWMPHFNELKTFSSKNGKQILFTEWGFRSTDCCCSKPWDTARGGSVNLEAQSNAFEATFKQFWEQDWFAGGFVWKWFAEHPRQGGTSDNRFTPQNKPAQEVLSRWFQKTGS
jgi:hypothetical protein